MSNSPEKMFLQWHGDEKPPFGDEPVDPADVTWCADRINDSDIEYVRADIVTAMHQEFHHLQLDHAAALRELHNKDDAIEHFKSEAEQARNASAAAIQMSKELSDPVVMAARLAPPAPMVFCYDCPHKPQIPAHDEAKRPGASKP